MIHEECGVFGIWQPENGSVAYDTYAGLYALQHRGQEAAGIAVSRQGVFHFHKDVGLVSEVFSGLALQALGEGNIAAGHVRYSTSGNPGRTNAQPIVVRHRKGNLAVCHNGNLVNSVQLREKLELGGCIFHTTSDTEVISYLVTQERLASSSIEEALERTMGRIEGAYSLILMSPSKLLAARDPHGFRPLCMGEKPDGAIVFASESCALDAVGARFVRDILPGEIVAAGPEGIRTIRTHCGEMPLSLCVFEYIYFARPDSVLEGCPVNRWRQEAGRRLAKTHPVDADVVVGVPDSGLDAAIGYADASGIPYRIGLVKNKYIARTFIAPSQEQRAGMVRLKLNPVREVVEGKRVVLVDDSIVRGTTSAQLAGLVREAGAAEIHLRICAPPFLHACYYGTDIDSEDNLIAVNHTVEETAKIIGVDSLGYLSVEDTGRICIPGDGRDACRVYSSDDGQNPVGIETFCDGLCRACFDGRYPTAVPSVSSKNRFELPIGG